MSGQPPHKEDVGLALSGGGFRATLFHLGVVRALAETGFLSRVTHITSVSGGSVLGAHLVQNWQDYDASSRAFEEASACAAAGRDPAEALKIAADHFNRPTQRLLDFIASDIRNDILRRMPWLLVATATCTAYNTFVGIIPIKAVREKLRFDTDRWRVVGQLTRSYEKLFGDVVLRDIAKDQPKAPRLAILATDVGSMEHAWFSSDGFCQRARDGSCRSSGRDILTLAQSVAASSAFPALFSPVRLDGATLMHTDDLRDSFVTDAGVYDNLGISGFLGRPFPDDTLKVFVSDATATCDWSASSKPGFLTNLLRSIDIMQQRAAQLQRERVALPQRDAKVGQAARGLEAGNRFLLFDIAREDIKTEPKIPETVQRHLSFVRTDLDAFSAEEMRMLVQHGYSVAWHALAETGRLPHSPPSHFTTWCAEWPRTQARNASIKRKIKIAQKARRSSVRLFKLTERMGLINAATLLLVLAGPPVAVWFANYQKNARWEREAQDSRKSLIATQQASAAQRMRHARGRIDSYRNFKFTPAEPVALRSLDQAGEDPGFANLKILSFEKLFDLRQWRPVPPGQQEIAPVEPAFQQTIYAMRREDAATKVRLPLKTNGYGIMPHVPSLTAELYQKATANGLYAKEIYVEIDLRRIPPGREYPVFVNATFWNGFQGALETAAFTAQTPGDSGVMMILFPEARTPHRFNFWRKPSKTKPLEMIGAPFYVVHQNGIYLEVSRPEVGCTYGIVFTWTDEETGSIDTRLPSLDASLLHPALSAESAVRKS